MLNLTQHILRRLNKRRASDRLDLINDMTGGIVPAEAQIITTTTDPFYLAVPSPFGDRLLTRFVGSRISQIHKSVDFYSDNVFTMLGLYRSADLVISDRVHVCAATLALGSSARFLALDQRSKDGRSSLLSRLGYQSVSDSVSRKNPGDVEDDKQAMRTLVRQFRML